MEGRASRRTVAEDEEVAATQPHPPSPELKTRQKSHARVAAGGTDNPKLRPIELLV